ncbi:toll/interleukin-1 receptor domain-containing protein [Methylicorpusculum sp.]|uniref:toll/interleukin-1 receptor domain-containing protein n=1 Tax=Methylicorpusculum sp. TaxID=2713644 RepID=UPI00272C1166|nr:toll/interleukin-1 receptor domain-containing protein [Methylicorpusculum sp.]
MSIVFISYRRSDSAGYTGRLADRLAKEWGEDLVFRDYDDISPGQNFFMTINDNLNSAHVMLVMMGKEWLTCLDEAGHRRIDDPEDFVRLEIETALQRNILIIPVLVKGARMPAPSDLPASISALAFRQAIELTDSRWAADVEKLIESVNPLLDQGLDKQRQVDGKSFTWKKAAGLIALGLLVSAIIGTVWLPADFSGHWYFDGGNYLRIVQQGDQVNIEHIDPAMQKVYETGEGRINGRWLEFTLKPIYTDRFSYSGRLNKSWNSQELQGELIEILSGEKSVLRLNSTDPKAIR